MFKNTASQKWTVFAFQDGGGTTPGAPVTGDAANITANIAIDDGTPAATNDVNPTEAQRGQYTFDLTQAETNGDKLSLFPTSSTANVQVIGLPSSVLYMDPASYTSQVAQTGDNYAVLSAGIAAKGRNNTLIERLQQIESLIEIQRPAHTHLPTGDVFYVDPVNGATHASGARGGITDPYAGVQDCHDNAVSDSAHDVIILMPGASGTVTTLTEAVTISKRYTFIRGPGRDFIWTRSGSGDTITVAADGIELSGFQLNTAGVGSGDGIQATSADFLRVSNVWVNDTQGIGLHLVDCDNFQVVNCSFQGTGQSGSGHGMSVEAGTGQSSDYGVITATNFDDVQGDCIRLDPSGTGTVSDTLILANFIQGAAGWGINITGANSATTKIFNNRFGNNTSGDVTDTGTDTVQVNNEQWAKDSICTEARLAELDAANLPADIANIWTSTLTEAYKTAGSQATGAQILYEMLSLLSDFSITGTTLTTRNLAGTANKTYTLDSATDPTSITETT